MRRFTFVLMLGQPVRRRLSGEFAVPYKGLLERGVLFMRRSGIDKEHKPFRIAATPSPKTRAFT
jgi:hypothetical protein